MSARQRGRESTVHRQFEVQAARTPDAVAVSLGGESYSYAELDERADRLARALRRRGVGPEVLVGISVRRSLEMVVGLLGILKSGGAYVPLDPGYPESRLAFMWRDSQADRPAGSSQLLLSDSASLPSLPTPWRAAGGPEILCLDRDWEAIAGEQGGNLDADLDGGSGPNNLAYVIYTSGSTGRPKGVLIPHRGVVNVVRECARLLAVGPESRFLQLASLSFDASALEIFTALSSGAHLVLTPRETLLSGSALAAELRRHAITTLAIPPSLLDNVNDEERFPELTSIIVGGEACSATTAARWSEGRTLVNAYAPTEATIFATAKNCAAAAEGPPPLGDPIADTRVELLDEELRPVPTGEVGELHLGGIGLARGYHGRPRLTAERFVPDPRAAADGGGGERLYRTGDQARYLPNGDLEFVGRVDHQVKVHGLRIELGEIEAELGSHPGVRSAVVTAREDPARGGAERRLVAYVVRRPAADEGAGPTVSELRGFLSRRLPAGMVPSAFVFLEGLPRTPTGKVDRSALPSPGSERPELDVAFRPPSGETESALARIWSELLGLDRIGIDDNLFELGGHSLLVAQIVSRIRDALGTEVPLLEIFEHPTVAGLAERLDRSDTASEATRLPAIERRREGEPVPLTFPQERVWFLQQLAPSAIAYNFQFTIRFTGDLDRGVLDRVLSEMVRRHEVLRTTFPAVGGRPVQVVHAPFEVTVPLVDLSGMAAAECEAAAEGLIEETIRQPFDVTRLPLLRWLLVRLGERDHLLLQVEHHFVHDGWSLAVFLREVKELYEAFRSGRPSPLEEPRIQYGDFAIWQRRWIDGEVLREQLAYWSDRLAGSLPLLELPTDRPRPRRHSFRGKSLRVDLPQQLYRDVRSTSRSEGVTLFMTMLAAFYALLHRYTGERDILLGSGVANRRLRETEEMLGMVVNTVVLRTRVEGDLPFRELLARVRQTTLETHLHQDLPFEKLVEELQPDRDLSRNPLFQVLFSFHDSPVPDLELDGLSGYLFERHNGSAKADLNVVVKPMAEQRVGRRSRAEGEQLTMVFEYSTDLFDDATIERMWQHYQNLLAAVVADPGRTIADLELVGEAERSELDSWNETEMALDSGPSVRARFEAKARRHPQADAIVWSGGRLTYSELDARAETLARRLSVGRGDLVAICTGRAPELVVAALAAWKRGAAYLPLDPSYPAEQLAFMLRDSGAAALISREGVEERLPAPAAGVQRIVLDARREESPGDAPRQAATEPDPAELAYVIYTSGSTGRPKAVEIPHGGLANLVAWHQHTYRVAPEDRATLLAGPAFDASVWELWPYLAAGASLEIPDPPTRTSPARLAHWLAEREITLSFLPTPLAEAVLAEERPPLALRALLTGGDRLHTAPDPGLEFALHNHYGPTESSVVATEMRVDSGSSVPPPIGRPIANTQIHVLDENLRRVPVGITGELSIGGLGLARGYRRRPALTAERFVPDPFSVEPGARLYRTGDLARWRVDGTLEFLGRSDRQVKIRGFRVELGEVEAALTRHPAVAEAVVDVRPVSAANPRLTAFVVDGEAFSTDEERERELQAFLRTKLPEQMVPVAFVPIEAVPLTPNGKIDRGALPDLDPEAADGSPSFLAPRTPTEELLADLWSRLIGIERVGVHDNFFHLGGHSLLATQLLSRVRDATGVDVPLEELFESPTVAALARAIDGRERPRNPAGENAIAARPSADGPPPLAFAQERLWFLDRLVPGNTAYNIARAFTIRGPLDRDALETACAALIGRHDTLRTSFAEHDGRPVQIVHPHRPSQLEETDLTALPPRLQEEEVDRLVNEEASRPFQLDRGPLLRVLLVRTGPGEHVLLLSMHHIISDGWSMGVLFRELEALYLTASGQPGPALAPLPIQYGDYAAWQRGRLRDEVVESLLAYWRRHLASAPQFLELPTDRPRPSVQGFRGAEVSTVLPPELTRRLTELSRTSGATEFITVLTAFAVLLHRYSGQSDLIVGTPIAGRNQSEVEGLIGFFVNTLPLRFRFGSDTTFRQALARAREATLGAHAHQELPFERLVEELAPERHLNHTPLFQVLFTLQEASPEAPELAGLEVEPIELRREESRFDLEMSVTRVDESLRAVLRYDRDLFSQRTVERMIGHFGVLLDAVVSDPDRAVASQPLLTAGERRELLERVNDTAAPANPPPTIPRAFEDQVARTPDEIALVAGRKRLSYGELNARANRLAHHLVALGVGSEVPVAIFVERGVDLVVGLLGILKAGGMYVPLDPAYPAERLAWILEDTQAPVVVTQRSLEGRLPAHQARVVRLDEDGSQIAREGDENPPSRATEQNLAYTIYTSGSTGRPKGVAIEHRNAKAMVDWASRVYSAEELSGVLASTSICFDLSVFELFVPLATGGTAILAENALELPDLEAAGEVSLINTVPSTMTELLRLGDLPASVRTVNLAGEPLHPPLVETILEQPAVERVYDLYGPSEDTTYSTFTRRRSGDPETIGLPIANSRAYVLDRHGQLVPASVPGEIYLGGAGVTRGYRGRPALTAESFLPDPFSQQAGARLYRTGDQARRLPDGRLVFLGRRDHQVKVRGFRIELGEIETLLEQHGRVREVVVVVREDRPGDRRLVAYVVGTVGGEEPAAGDLRSFVRKRLPGYMVPDLFEILDALPRTPNGKVNRGELPVPGGSQEGLEESFLEPLSAAERRLAAIWSEVLGAETIGLGDDFFDLGGHSLLATQLVARVRREFAVELPLRAVFEAPTISGMLAEIRRLEEEAGDPQPPTIARQDRAARRRRRSTIDTKVRGG